MKIKNVFKFFLVSPFRSIASFFEKTIDEGADFFQDALGEENKPYVEATHFTVANDGTPEFNEEIPETTS